MRKGLSRAHCHKGSDDLNWQTRAPFSWTRLATYYFVSADAKKLFDANPEKYLSAYGGWCAFGMSVKDKFSVDPTNFKIVDGKLMVFLKNKNVDALALWNQGDKEKLIRKSAAHWKKVSE